LSVAKLSEWFRILESMILLTCCQLELVCLVILILLDDLLLGLLVVNGVGTRWEDRQYSSRRILYEAKVTHTSLS
jgi:hypothetical protein